MCVYGGGSVNVKVDVNYNEVYLKIKNALYKLYDVLILSEYNDVCVCVSERERDRERARLL